MSADHELHGHVEIVGVAQLPCYAFAELDTGRAFVSASLHCELNRPLEGVMGVHHEVLVPHRHLLHPLPLLQILPPGQYCDLDQSLVLRRLLDCACLLEIDHHFQLLLELVLLCLNHLEGALVLGPELHKLEDSL